MTINILLAHLIGIYMFIVGMLFMIRPSLFSAMLTRAMSNTFLAYIASGVELVAGTAIVLTYADWAMSFEALMLVLGWVMILESAAYLFIPFPIINAVVARFNRNTTFIIIGTVLFVAGAYLMYESGLLLVG